MALEGSLADFGIAEILQLISSQQKTGILHVSDPSAESVQVLFSSGRIIGCEVLNRDRKSLLGSMLLDAELITKEQLNRALKVQKQSLKRVGDALIEAGALTHPQLLEFTDLQRRETLYKLFEWKRGTYRFESKPPNFVKPTGNAISPESVLMEGFRILDEWPLIRVRINNYETVYRLLREIGDLETEAQTLNRILDDAFSEVAESASVGRGQAANDPRLGQSERRVLARIDGKRNVFKLIAMARLGEFETCKALLNLLNDGYIAPVQTRRAVESPRSAGRRPGLGITVVLNVLVLVGLVAGVVLMPTTQVELKENARQLMLEAHSRLRSNRISVIGTALEVYLIEMGDYPESLTDLVESKLIDPSTLDMGNSAPLQYVSIGSDYDLR